VQISNMAEQVEQVVQAAVEPVAIYQPRARSILAAAAAVQLNNPVVVVQAQPAVQVSLL
jgi:hypothetical protein